MASRQGGADEASDQEKKRVERRRGREEELRREVNLDSPCDEE